jgi:hypothetical protein
MFARFMKFAYNSITDLQFLYHTVTRMSDSRRGFGFHIGFIDHFTTQLVITLNYSPIVDFHTLQFTGAHAKSFRARSVFISICLVTALTMSISLLPGSVLSERRLPSNWTNSSFRPAYDSSARITVENTASNSTSTVARGLLPQKPICLRSLPRNGSTRYSAFSHSWISECNSY